METGMIATLMIGSLLTMGTVVGVASMNGGMTLGTHMDGMQHQGMHDHESHEECEEYMEELGNEYCEGHEDCEEWESTDHVEMHEECEEHMEEWEHSVEDDHEGHDHCAMR